MVKHIILWKLKEELSIEDKQQIKKEIKAGLEGLKGKIEGLLEVNVITEGLDSSTADVMLDSTFESEEALKAYKVNPAHVEVATAKVRPYVQVRLAYDFKGN